MHAPDHETAFLPPALRAEVEAIAAAEHRRARDVLRDAVERYLEDRRSLDADGDLASQAAREAASRILARRKYHPLPDGVTVRDLLIFGRA